MKSNYEDDLNEDFFLTSKTEKVTKDDILDENFQKAENKKESISKNEKTTKKKHFLKSGIILVIIAVICLGIIQAPWAYVNFDSDNNGEIDRFIYKNQNQNDIGYDNESQQIINFFESNNCSSSSCNYIGLDFNDFSSTPKTMFYGFTFLAILGLIFIIFQILDRMRNFSFEMFTIVHSIFSAVTIIVSMFILIAIFKFIGVYFLIYYNEPFITSTNILFISPVAIILILILSGIIKTAFSIIKINRSELNKKFNVKKTKNPFFIYKGGEKLR